MRLPCPLAEAIPQKGKSIEDRRFTRSIWSNEADQRFERRDLSERNLT